MYSNNNGSERPVRPPLLRETDVLLLFIVGGAFFLLLYIATTRWRFSMRGIQEIAAYTFFTLGAAYLITWQFATRQRRRKEAWPALSISRTHDAKNLQKAWAEDSVVLGHDSNATPWLWPDRVRVMQGIVLGQTGSGKTTLLRNIITQDLARRIGPPEDRHKI